MLGAFISVALPSKNQSPNVSSTSASFSTSSLCAASVACFIDAGSGSSLNEPCSSPTKRMNYA